MLKKIIKPGLIAGVLLIILSITGIYATTLFPGIALEYFNPAFNNEPGKIMLYYIHPFIIGMALSWFWDRFKGGLKGSFLTRGIEFGLIYLFVAIFPMLWLLYSTMSVSLPMISTWFALAMAQAVISGLIFERMNP